MKNKEKLYEEAIGIFGIEKQLNMCMEEMGELIFTINKYRRGKLGKADLIEEIADCLNMVEEMAYHFGIDEVNKVRQKKFDRVRRKIIKHKEKYNG